MSRTPDVLVVGAGIVGAACAYELAKEKIKVAVVEATGVGTGATAAGMGHIVAMDNSEAQFALTRYSQRLWQELQMQCPATMEYEETGTIWVAADEAELAEVQRKHEYYGARGVATDMLDAQALREAEPNLNKSLVGGLRVPSDAVLYPPCAATFLIQEAVERGAQVYTGHAVTSIGKGRALLTDGTRFSAKVIVNATGQYATRLTPGIQMKPRKGHLVITERYVGEIRHQLVELGYLKSAHSTRSDSVAFNVQPRKTGQLLIGSSRQFESNDGKVNAGIAGRMLRRAFQYIPDLAALSAIRVWTGFRAATPDNLPLIGPWNADPTTFLATGHEGLGITTSLATGRLIADRFLGRASEIPSEPYLPSRQQEATSHA
jgi:glycine/D-amino acid oxidase-like deaminating enzyme